MSDTKKIEAVNPFIADLEIKALRLASNKEMFIKDDYDYADGIKQPKIGTKAESHNYTYSYLVDSEQGTSLFKNATTERVLEILSDRASRMLLYIIRHLPKGVDIITIEPAEYCKTYKLDSVQSAYNAIRDLSDAGIIQRHKPNRYWINPMIIFNGNRIKKYKDRVEVEWDLTMKDKKKDG